MSEWEPAIRKELTSLFETTRALRRTSMKELGDLPGASEMEQAPMKLVATVKAPDGRKKARLVLCGNLIQSSTEDQVAAAKDPLGCPLYAGGLDGVCLEKGGSECLEYRKHRRAYCIFTGTAAIQQTPCRTPSTTSSGSRPCFQG